MGASTEPGTPEPETPEPEPREGGESLLTVIVALAANGLLAIAKTVAAVLSGSAAMVAEAAHSWADTGNEVFLLIAERTGSRPRDESHPRGYGRATYAWSLIAGFGLFTAGAVVSVWHGISQLGSDVEETDYLINYVVLAIALVMEGTSFFQASRQLRGDARRIGLHPLRFVTQTSNPTLRAVFFEDLSALIGIAVATVGIGLHEITGDAVYDALASIVIGILLGFVAVFLISRNMDYLVGQVPPPMVRSLVLTRILEHPQVHRVGYLHLEWVGPERVFAVVAVDLVGDDSEEHLAIRLRRVERDLERADLIEDAVLTLATPDEPSL